MRRQKRQKEISGLSTYRRLLGYVRPYRLVFALGLLATILGSSLDASLTYMLKPLLDKGFIAQDHAFLLWVPPVTVAIFLIRGGFIFGSSYSLTWVGRNVVMVFRQHIFRHLMRVPATFYDQETSGKLLSMIIYNVEQVADACTTSVLTIVREGALVIGLLVVMFAISWKLSLFFLLVAPILSWFIKRVSQRLRYVSTGVQDAMGDVTHVAEEAIEGYKVIRTFGGESYEREKFEQATQNNRHRTMKVAVADAISSPIVQVIVSFPIALSIYVATGAQTAITAGAFTAFLAAMLAVLSPLKRLTRVNTNLQRGIAGAQSIFELLAVDTEHDTGTHTVARCQGQIVFKDVGFHYSRTQDNALNDISFEVMPGQIIAIVGRSGSGKSTLVNLLPRFYDHQAGMITIDGTNIVDYRLSSLRDQFALVSQQVVLFNDTIANNIAYGRLSTVKEAEIIAAAEAAHAMEFIRLLPLGLNTLIGENGVLLSGGQRQRIAIARAILKDAPILILDEATASLDTESERYIQGALDKVMQNRTTLVIAHRLSTIENADRILVMNEGRIVESGTHTELLALAGHYGRLHAMQFQEGLVQSAEAVSVE